MECFYCDGELKCTIVYTMDNHEGDTTGLNVKLKCTDCGATWQGFTFAFSDDNEEVE